MKDINIQSKVASVQMTGGVNLQANLDQAKSFIKIAAKKGVKLLVLPENFAYFGQREIKNICNKRGVCWPRPVHFYQNKQVRTRFGLSEGQFLL